MQSVHTSAVRAVGSFPFPRFAPVTQVQVRATSRGAALARRTVRRFALSGLKAGLGAVLNSACSELSQAGRAAYWAEVATLLRDPACGAWDY